MNCAIAAFTHQGVHLGLRLCKLLDGTLYAPIQFVQPHVQPMLGGVRKWTARTFFEYDALIFIGAAGIAVRAIAPHIKDKMTDPAIIVIDELGKHIIPILSGHIGGANALAVKLETAMGAQAILTTATDVNGIPAIDSWALDQNMAIENPSAIKAFSAQALKKAPVGVAITERCIKPPFPITLRLRPRTLTLGVGCRRDTLFDTLDDCVRDFLARCGVSMLAVEAFASIDRKADEPALNQLSAKYQIPFVTFSAAELVAAPGTFASSAFVLDTVGVDNVCERAAVVHSRGRLLEGKTLYTGIALALAGRDGAL